MTPKQAEQLRIMIADYRDAAITNYNKGGGDPADWPEIEECFKRNKENLENLIHQLTTPPAIGE